VSEIFETLKQLNELTNNKLDNLIDNFKRLDADTQKALQKISELSEITIVNKTNIDYCKKDINNLWKKLREDRSELTVDMQKEIDEMKKDCYQEIRLSASKIKLWVAFGVISALATIVINVLSKVL